jgi:hypothetical protein
LLDTGDVTLQYPDRHTVHCLIDVPSCKESDYEILAAPAATGGLYSRAFRFDDAAKQGLQRLAARTGAMNPTDAFAAVPAPARTVIWAGAFARKCTAR